MRTLAYATAFSALLMATSAQAAVTLDFLGNTGSWVSVQGQTTNMPDGGVVATAFKFPAPSSRAKAPVTFYGGSATTDVQIEPGGSASFTSGVAARGQTAVGEASWGSSASSTSGIVATLTNTGGAPVQLKSIQSTIIQAGMGFMVQNPTGTAIDNDVFTGYGLNDKGSFGDFYKPSLAGQTIARAGFSFNVYGDAYGVVGEEATPLYTLSGFVSLGFDDGGNIVENSDVAAAQSVLSGFAPIYPKTDGFGHVLPITNADRIAGYEWDETNIPVALNQLLGAGLSTNLYYVANASVDIAMPCVSATECLVGYSGFGDPVGRGGGVSADFASFFSSSADPSACPEDTSQICFSPQTIQPFSNLSTSGGVPEPAIWLSMILGFGLSGAALRRRGALSYS